MDGSQEKKKKIGNIEKRSKEKRKRREGGNSWRGRREGEGQTEGMGREGVGCGREE